MPAWFLVTWCFVMIVAHMPAISIASKVTSIVRESKGNEWVAGFQKLAVTLLILDLAFWFLVLIAIVMAWVDGAV